MKFPSRRPRASERDRFTIASSRTIASFLRPVALVRRSLLRGVMLEIIALCSCACLACLWCVLAVEVARDRWILRRCERCWWCKRGRKSDACRDPRDENLRSPSRARPTYKFVCKTCRRAKPECICAKLFRRRAALSRYGHAGAPSVRDSSLPDLTCRGTPQPSSLLAACLRCTAFSRDESMRSRENRRDDCKPRSSSCKRIAKRGRKRRRSKRARKR